MPRGDWSILMPDCLFPGATTAQSFGGPGFSRAIQASLSVREVAPQFADVILRQDADEFLGEVVGGSGRGTGVALVIHGATLVDVVLQTVVQILLGAPFGDLRLVVELDLVDQQL